ncbi:hypothetical protein LZ31DRAFT_117778 [Colletotrichum somersetense]|nr:hypothetical protein LZ31DRAFT_117778 [Colletotrichum somersetense]
MFSAWTLWVPCLGPACLDNRKGPRRHPAPPPSHLDVICRSTCMLLLRAVRTRDDSSAYLISSHVDCKSLSQLRIGGLSLVTTFETRNLVCHKIDARRECLDGRGAALLPMTARRRRVLHGSDKRIWEGDETCDRLDTCQLIIITRKSC